MNFKKMLLSMSAAAGLLVAGSSAIHADNVKDVKPATPLHKVKYTVKSGDTLSQLASAYNVTAQAIQQENNIKNINLIYVGQQLEIQTSLTEAQLQQHMGQVVYTAPAAHAVAQTQAPVQAAPVKSATPASQAAKAQVTTPQIKQAVAKVTPAPAKKATPVQVAPKQAPVVKKAAPVQVTPKQAPVVKPVVKKAAPVVQAQLVQKPVYHAPVAQPVQQTHPVAMTAIVTPAQSDLNAANASARQFIANHESGGSYTATNGVYYGKYQLDRSYLNGNYSAANQDRVANQYVSQRYGSWVNAKAHWVRLGWY